jgi:dihydrolipoamide dehydrogenase
LTVFSDPEIACVGLTEKQARAKGIETSVGRFLFAAVGKAVAHDETEGFVSIVADKKSGEVLGGQIAGLQASNLIQEIVLAVRLRLKAKDLAETLHSHPTLVEAVMEAALDVNGEAIHKLRK